MESIIQELDECLKRFDVEVLQDEHVSDSCDICLATCRDDCSFAAD